MILVTTPNGKVGSEVVKQLLEQGESVRLAAHTPQKARDAFPDAEVVPFKFGEEESVQAALQGVSALYLASPDPMPPVQQVVDLAQEAGVKRVVRLSAMGIEESDNPLRQIERYIEASGLKWTFLRPNWFMQNYSTTNAQSVREQGVIAEPAGDAKTRLYRYPRYRSCSSKSAHRRGAQRRSLHAHGRTAPTAATRSLPLFLKQQVKRCATSRSLRRRFGSI